MAEVLYSVPEIHCAACEASIRRAVERVPGVSEVSVDLDARSVRVRFDEEATSSEEVRDRIERAGFEVA